MDLKDYEITYKSFSHNKFKDEFKEKCTKDSYLVFFMIREGGSELIDYGRILTIEYDRRYGCEYVDTTNDSLIMYASTHIDKNDPLDLCCPPNNWHINDVHVAHFYICKKEELHDLINELHKIHDNLQHEKEVNEFNETLYFLLQKGYDESALELIKKAPKWFDINDGLSFSALHHHAFKTFEYIITHPSFNINSIDEFGENIVSELYFEENGFISAKWTAGIKYFTELIFNNKNFDKNQLNHRNEDILSLALKHLGNLESCIGHWGEYFCYLIKEVKLNVNNVNKFNETPLSIAIKRGAIYIIEILLERDDLIIRQEDIELAKEMKNGSLSLLTKKEVTHSCDVEKVNFYGVLKKLCHNRQENEAIKLIQDNTNLFSPNDTFKSCYIWEYAIKKKMYNLLELIIRHPNFDANCISIVSSQYLNIMYFLIRNLSWSPRKEKESLEITMRISKLLCENKDFNININVYAFNILAHAIHNMSEKCLPFIEFLIDNGVELNDMNGKFDETPLEEAINWDKKSFINALLKSPNLKIRKEDKKSLELMGIELTQR
jgi:hypothetical protein